MYNESMSRMDGGIMKAYHANVENIFFFSADNSLENT